MKKKYKVSIAILVALCLMVGGAFTFSPDLRTFVTCMNQVERITQSLKQLQLKDAPWRKVKNWKTVLKKPDAFLKNTNDLQRNLERIHDALRQITYTGVRIQARMYYGLTFQVNPQFKKFLRKCRYTSYAQDARWYGRRAKGYVDKAQRALSSWGINFGGNASRPLNKANKVLKRYTTLCRLVRNIRRNYNKLADSQMRMSRFSNNRYVNGVLKFVDWTIRRRLKRLSESAEMVWYELYKKTEVSKVQSQKISPELYAEINSTCSYRGDQIRPITQTFDKNFFARECIDKLDKQLRAYIIMYTLYAETQFGVRSRSIQNFNIQIGGLMAITYDLDNIGKSFFYQKTYTPQLHGILIRFARTLR